MKWFDDLNEKQRIIAMKVMDAAERNGVDPEYALATAMAESKLNHGAISRDKEGNPIAYGVMQLKPTTAKELKADHLNEDQNIDAGVRYLKQMLDKTGGDRKLASVAYNAGPNSSFFTTGVAPKESEDYVSRIGEYGGYSEAAPAAAAAPAQASNNTAANDLLDQGPATDLSDIKLGGAVVGGGLGAAASRIPGKSASQIQVEQRNQAKSREDVKLANDNIKAENARKDAMHREALELRNKQIDAARAAQEATGVAKYVPTQTKSPGVAQSVITNPNVILNADAQAALPVAAAGERKAMNLFGSSGAGVFDPERGFVVPQGTPLKQAAAPIESRFPMPAAPTPTPLKEVPKWQAPDRGMRGGRALTGATGAATGYELGDMAERFANADPLGGTLSGLSALSSGIATGAKKPKTAIMGAVGSALGEGAKRLLDYFGPDTGPIPKKKENELGNNYAAGGLASLPHYAGAKDSLVKKLAGAAEGALNNFVARPTQEVKFSEAIAPHEGKFLGAHMSDRFGTHGTRMGGTGFPNFQNVSPKHQAENVVWMNDSELAARKLIENSKFNGQPMIHTNYIGSPSQHASNKTVHADVLDNFYKNLAAGKLTDAQIAKINAGIAARSRDTGTVKKTPFSQNFDIRDRFAAQEIGSNTMDSRRALSDMLGTGEGVGGTKNIAVPTYQDILKSHADPLTEGAPTSSMGTRLFEIFDEPTKFSEEFHPDYRWTVHGKDQGVQFPAVPQSVGARDFYNEFKQRFPDMEPHGNAWFAYPKKPQLITEDYIRNAQDLGFAEGGLAHCM